MEKQFYITKEQFEAAKAAWKQKSYHSASEIIIYNILRSMPADRGFTEKRHGIQGNDPWYGYNSARSSAMSSLKYGHNDWFKNTFGIESPYNLYDLLRDSSK